MGYTAIKKMREKNHEKYGLDYPREPKDLRNKKTLSNLERECLNFLRDTCEGLRFDALKEDLEDLDGRSIKANQIPYNMEKDIDRMCLENAVHRFMQSGIAQDAFDVYFCYLEMFIGGYATSKKMIEMLAEFESNASALLMKHRDHYSHSVYVFILGLAIYQSSPLVRKAYQEYYGLEDGKSAAHHYLQYWGMASLFHDIGYPFELPFEQVKSYFGKDAKGVPFVRYNGMKEYIKLSDSEAAAFATVLGTPLKKNTLNEVLAMAIPAGVKKKYGKNTEEICNKVLGKKASRPDKFNMYMDHAYFSGILLLHQLMEVAGAEKITKADLDALTAIVLHNSMYKFSITNIKDSTINHPFELHLHPLAYILMLCDELQCWDRTSYGQNSRRELHPMWCDFQFEDNHIKAVYYYDMQMAYKSACAEGTYKKMTDETISFVKDIEDILYINGKDTLELGIETRFVENRRKAKLYLSDSSFLHLYQFAVALNGRYSYGDETQVEQKQLEADFDALSLEYKISNILQAKAFAKYLEAIGCFYTDRPVDYEILESFSDSHMDIIGPMEHDRWLKEKASMGWNYDTAYCDREYLKSRGILPEVFKMESKKLRELTRTHELMIEDYEELAEEEQDKDTKPMNSMLRLIREYDGLRIYRIG